MSATLDDLLEAAAAGIGAALSADTGGDADPQEPMWQLGWLAAAMARCLDQAAPCDQVEAARRPDLAGWDRAMVDAAAALRLAASRLGEMTGDAVRAAPVAGPCADGLTRAAGALAAAGDLMATHTGTGPDGIQYDRSPWAAVLASPTVRRAAAWELTRHAGPLAALAHRLAAESRPATPGRDDEHGALLEAGQWLLAAAGASRVAGETDPVSASDVVLLRAVPLAVPPPRDPPSGAEDVAGLCAGITVTAERLRILTFQAAPRPGQAAGTTADTWKYTAGAAVITSHAAAAVLQVLAAHAGTSGTVSAAVDGLQDGAVLMMAAARAWERVHGMWGAISTAVRGRTSPVATGASDLMLRAGRLAYSDPEWGPGRPQRPRLAGDLAAGQASITALAAVHQAADALAAVAAADLASVTAVSVSGGLYVPTRSLPEGYDVPRRFALAPPDRAAMLREAYQAAVAASTDAALVLDGLALRLDAPSTVLALARAATGQRGQARATGRPPSIGGQEAAPSGWRPGPVEKVIQELHVTDPGLLLRAVVIDKAAFALVNQATQAAPQPGPPAANGAQERATLRALRATARSTHPSGAGTRRQPPEPATEPGTSAGIGVSL